MICYLGKQLANMFVNGSERTEWENKKKPVATGNAKDTEV